MPSLGESNRRDRIVSTPVPCYAPFMIRKSHFQFVRLAFLIVLVMATLLPATSSADGNANEDLYRKLLNAADTGETALITRLNEQARLLGWGRADKTHFTGNLRVIKSVEETGSQAENTIYLLRKLTGELFILSVPANPSERNEDADSPYAGLDGISGNKMIFNVSTFHATIDGQTYPFARLTSRPEQMKLDRIFKISIILMLFFVMVGMGMTLTFKEFTLVFRQPRGIILGELLQFGLMPFIAMCLGHLLGFYEQYPFIFVGMILITAIPGGVTSNLMTYYAKGGFRQ